MQGQLSIKVVDDKGLVVSEETVKNLILNTAFDKIVGLLGNLGTGYVNRIQVGTGSASPVAGDTTMQLPISPTITVSASVSTTSITFTGNLAYNQAIGFSISEAGLLTNDGTLVARTTFSPKTKTNRYVFYFTWVVGMKPSS